MFYEADNVYGDRVNIASRVESLAVAGSVLFSKRIRQHIENQSEFEIKSLGAFDFKNVNKTMEVYALVNQGLVVPKRSEMKGKVKGNSLTSKYLIAVIALFVIVGAYTVYQLLSKNNTPQISSEIRKERIAVIPFENNTGDAELDNLGVVAADWINEEFMDMDEVEVVSNFTIRTHKASIGIMDNDPEGRTSFAKLTGAQNLITGSFYREEEKLVFKLEMVDALQGDLLYSFDEIKGEVHLKQELLQRLRERVNGYWAVREALDTKRFTTPPKYEAYQKIKAERFEEPRTFIRMMSQLALSKLTSASLKSKIRRDIIDLYYELEQDEFKRIAWRNYTAMLEQDISKISLEHLHLLSISMQIVDISFVGRTYADAGEIEETQKIIEKLEEYRIPPSLTASSDSHGALAHYYIGQLQGKLTRP